MAPQRQTARAIQTLGRLSYSMYLIRVPVCTVVLGAVLHLLGMH